MQGRQGGSSTRQSRSSPLGSTGLGDTPASQATKRRTSWRTKGPRRREEDNEASLRVARAQACARRPSPLPPISLSPRHPLPDRLRATRQPLHLGANDHPRGRGDGAGGPRRAKKARNIPGFTDPRSPSPQAQGSLHRPSRSGSGWAARFPSRGACGPLGRLHCLSPGLWSRLWF